MAKDKSPKIKRRKGKDKIKERMDKYGKFTQKYIRNKECFFTQCHQDNTSDQKIVLP